MKSVKIGLMRLLCLDFENFGKSSERGWKFRDLRIFGVATFISLLGFAIMSAIIVF